MRECPEFPKKKGYFSVDNCGNMIRKDFPTGLSFDGTIISLQVKLTSLKSEDFKQKMEEYYPSETDDEFDTELTFN